jgi:uroporphyrinogen III methyltransferase/synthase
VPDEYVAEALARRLGATLAAGDRVLLPRAAETRDLLVRELGAQGARVDEVAAYRTRPAEGTGAEVRALLARGEVDVVTFTSSSTARHFAALFAPGELARLMRGVRVACIGPVTRATAETLGLDTAIMPAEYTIPALAAAIASHYGNEKRS